VFTGVLEERAASISRVEAKAKKGKSGTDAGRMIPGLGVRVNQVEGLHEWYRI
jgi:hypothetical protein